MIGRYTMVGKSDFSSENRILQNKSEWLGNIFPNIPEYLSELLCKAGIPTMTSPLLNPKHTLPALGVGDVQFS